MKGVPIRQKIVTGKAGIFFFLPEYFGFILHCFCGAAATCCALSSFVHIPYQKHKLGSKYPTWGIYVRAATARDAKLMWRLSCFLLKHGGGTLGIFKSPVCNYDHNKKLYSIMDLCQTLLRTVI